MSHAALVRCCLLIGASLFGCCVPGKVALAAQPREAGRAEGVVFLSAGAGIGSFGVAEGIEAAVWGASCGFYADAAVGMFVTPSMAVVAGVGAKKTPLRILERQEAESLGANVLFLGWVKDWLVLQGRFGVACANVSGMTFDVDDGEFSASAIMFPVVGVGVVPMWHMADRLAIGAGAEVSVSYVLDYINVVENGPFSVASVRHRIWGDVVIFVRLAYEPELW